MFHDNLPDSWDSYWSTCSTCGKRYHLSGTDPCDCEPCEACGEPMVTPVCPSCGESVKLVTLSVITQHVSRVNTGGVRVGDRYNRVVQAGTYYVGGKTQGRWFEVQKIILTKGPAWKQDELV